MKIPERIVQLLPKPWEEMNFSEKRFTATMISYAAGDAFGGYYEFSEIVSNVPNILLQKENWPFGGTSDDTSLTILTLLSLKENSPEDAALRFLNLLHLNIAQLRGLGPTTRAALGLPVKDSEVASIGLTNGAMMRTALLGLIFIEQERDLWVNALASGTHRSYAVDASTCLAHAFSSGFIDNVSDWENGSNGVANDACETLKAINYVTKNVQTPLDAMLRACALGGDTDTVAALSASLVCSRLQDFDSIFEIPWLEKVDWNGIQGFSEALHIVFERLAIK